MFRQLCYLRRDLVPIVSALVHNTWFTGLNAANIKLVGTCTVVELPQVLLLFIVYCLLCSNQVKIIVLCIGHFVYLVSLKMVFSFPDGGRLQ